MHVSSTESRQGDEFLKVKLKNSEFMSVTVPILKQSNQTITETYLKRLNQKRGTGHI